MSIKVTMAEVRNAYRAFKGTTSGDNKLDGGIGNAVLPPKASLRVAKLIRALKDELTDFEEAQRKIIIDAGGVNEMGAALLKLDPRKDDETQDAYDARAEEHRKKVNDINDKVSEMLKEEVDIAVEPLPLSIFENERAPEKSAQLRPVDLADAGQFIRE